MKSNDTIANEVLLRAKIAANKKKYNKIKRKGICIIGLMLSFCIPLLRTIGMEAAYHLDAQSSFGSVIYIYDSTGIYVTIGVAMFVIGMALTIVYVKLSSMDNRKRWFFIRFDKW